LIRLTPQEDGVCLPIRAQGGARQTGLRGEHGGALKATVTQAPEKGKANKAIHALLCRELGLRRSQLTLLSGATSNNKTFLVRDCPIEALRERIERAVAGSGPGSTPK
jgi:uncharacterized protein YggU (UPF0235/DUF167 family)